MRPLFAGAWTECGNLLGIMATGRPVDFIRPDINVSSWKGDSRFRLTADPWIWYTYYTGIMANNKKRLPLSLSTPPKILQLVRSNPVGVTRDLKFLQMEWRQVSLTFDGVDAGFFMGQWSKGDIVWTAQCCRIDIPNMWNRGKYGRCWGI